MVRKTASATLPTKFGIFRMNVYTSPDGIEHVVLIKGKPQSPMLVRLHSSCITGDIFSSLKCDCGEQLERAMECIQKEGSGMVIYLNQEGRGIGLTNKIKAYSLQERGDDTVEANLALGLPIDARNYEAAACILSNLGIQQVRLLTNNPDREHQLLGYGITVIEKIPLEVKPNMMNRRYLYIKKKKMSHILSNV